MKTIRVKVKSLASKTNLLHFLVSQGYANSNGKTVEAILAFNNHEGYPNVMIEKTRFGYDKGYVDFVGSRVETEFAWPEEADKIIDFVVTINKVKLNDTYNAVLDVENKVVKVGCQDIPFDAVLALAKAINKATD